MIAFTLATIFIAVGFLVNPVLIALIVILTFHVIDFLGPDPDTFEIRW